MSEISLIRASLNKFYKKWQRNFELIWCIACRFRVICVQLFSKFICLQVFKHLTWFLLTCRHRGLLILPNQKCIHAMMCSSYDLNSQWFQLYYVPVLDKSILMWERIAGDVGICSSIDQFMFSESGTSDLHLKSFFFTYTFGYGQEITARKYL